MTGVDDAGEVRVQGAEAVGAWLSERLDPTRCRVVPRRAAPTVQASWVRLRSLRGVVLRTDHALTLEVTPTLGPVLTVPLGHGPSPTRVTRPPSPAIRRSAIVSPVGDTTSRTVDRDQVLALVHLPQAALEMETESLLEHAVTRRVTFDRSIDLTGPTGRQLAAAIDLMWTLARDRSPLPDSELGGRRLEQLVLDQFLLAADHIEDELEDADAAVATPWVRRAVDLLDASPERRWSVATLSHEVAVSERALHVGFRRDLDTTPMAYLLDLRLDRAREALAHRPVRTTVTQAAHHVGFAHLSRFAAAYRTRFGETPSQTLRR